MAIRAVWDRYTNVNSEFNLAKTRLIERRNKLNDVDSSSILVDTNCVKQIEMETKVENCDKGHVDEHRLVKPLSKVEGQGQSFALPVRRKSNQKFLGKSKRQLVVLVILLVVFLIIYCLLLSMTAKTAQCKDKLKNMLEERNKWQELMKMRGL